MRFAATVAVALLLLVASLAPVSVSSESVEQIIHRHWLNLKRSVDSEQQSGTSESRRSTVEVHEETAHSGHTCDHDQVLKDIDVESIHRDVANYARTHPIPQRPAKRAVEAFGNMRVERSSSYLQANSDTGYACYSVGQSFTRSAGGTGTGTCTANDILTDTQRTQLINNVIPAAMDIISSLLQVDQPAGNLILDATYYNANAQRRNCVAGVPIPASYVSTGVANADYFVWFTARPANSTTNLASALACNIQILQSSPSVKYGRPLAGYINFNPAGLANTDLSNSFKFARYVRVAVHEFMHALGFSSFFYPHFANDNGQFYTNPVVSTTLRGSSVQIFTTPRVTKFAQDHYACPTLTGLEIENGGGTGTAGSHWEARLMNNDIMTGFADLYLIISNATLAMFRDMGWYRVNWALAEPYYMGYQQGCSFALDKCNTWTQQKTFCSVAGARSCTVDRRARGYCDYATGQTIPTQYRYFTDTTAGGFFIRDYCPITIGFGNTYCGDAQALNQGFETLGTDDSRCFDVVDGSTLQACLRHRCTNGVLQLFLSGNWVDCSGASVAWPGTTRTVQCDPILCTSVQTTVDSPVASTPNPTPSPTPTPAGSGGGAPQSGGSTTAPSSGQASAPTRRSSAARFEVIFAFVLSLVLFSLLF